VLGAYGPSSAGPVAVVEAASKQASAPPRLTLEPLDTSVAAGSSVTFTAAAAGTAIGVQWQLSSDGGRSWGRIVGADAPSYSFVAALAENGYRFRAVFTSHGRSTTTAAATLTVTAPVVTPAATPQAGTTPVGPSASAAAASAPQITEQPANVGALDGSTVTFTAQANGSPAPSVKWQVSYDGLTWQDIPGATSTSYTFVAESTENGYQYRAVFTNSSGPPQTSESATLTVSDTGIAPQIDMQPSNQMAAAGSVASFTAGATGVPTPTVQWFISSNAGATWAAVSGATSATYAFAVTNSENGDYLEAQFSNSYGTATSDIAFLTVNADSSPPAVLSEPITQSVVAGTTVNFTATASGVPAPTVQWQVSVDDGSTWSIAPGFPSNATTYSFTAGTPDNGHQYRALFTNSAGSVASQAAGLTVSPSQPQVTTQPVSQVVATGSSATFSAAASADPAPSVQWQVSMNSGSTWGDIANAQSTGYTVADVDSSESGYQYRAVFTNVAGTATTNAATLTVGIASTASPNWSGYAATGAVFTNVSGIWNVPSVSCSGSGDLYSSFWVGIDGASDSTVEQDGTDSDCNGATPAYYGWYEMYPDSAVVLGSGYPVSPGDEMVGGVSVSGSQWTLTLEDATAHWTFQTEITEGGLQQSSAEWIAEAPTLGSSLASLADFGSVSFRDAGATGNGQSGTISSFSHTAFNMTNQSGTVVRAYPSALDGAGDAFNDTWLAN
jgi:hypothetical protein